MHSLDVIASNVEKIAHLFPNCVTESLNKDGKPELAIDFEKLQAELSNDIIAEGEERYQFTWPDKRAAVRLANTPTTMTLRPCREESVDFDNTQNLYIEGDNLDVLKVLRETYLGKVKMIYIDPPYNTGNDFVYNDDFAQGKGEFEQQSGLFDEDGNQTVDPMQRNTESNGRFHTDWLNMIYPRLKIARDLLSEDGVFMISIDDNEIHNLRKITDEIMGEQNFVDYIVWNKRVPKNDNKGIGNIHEYILVYVKNNFSISQFYMPKEGLDEIYDYISELKKKKTHIPEAENQLKLFYKKKGYDRGITLYCNLDNQYEPWGKINMSWPNADTFGPTFDVLHPITKVPTKKPDRGWRWNQKTFETHLDYSNIVQRWDGSFVCGNIWFAKDEQTQPSSIKYLRDVGKMLLRSIISLKSDGGIEIESLLGSKSIFSYPKSSRLLKILINSIEDKEGVYLDFFSGASTTADAVMQLNAEDGGKRRFIMVQLPETTGETSEAFKAGYKNICEIGKERIRRAGKKVKEEAGLDGQNLDVGFRVLKLDSSNMADVYYTPQDSEQKTLFNENVKPDRSNEDLLFQVMLDLGVELSAKIEVKQIAGKTVHFVDGNYLVACFDSEVNDSTIKEIAKQQPVYFVMRDSSAANDNVIDNFEQIFRHYSPETNCRIL